jgi:hypothetical protein
LNVVVRGDGGDGDDDMTALLAVEEEDTVDLLHNIIIFEGRGGR